MGYSLLEVNGKKLKLIKMDTIRLTRVKDIFERLGIIHQSMNDLIREHKPDELAIEAPFFGKNVQSMLKLGRAQGVAIAVAMQKGLPVTEYSPRKIKQAITGNGNADKEQVWKMLKIILQIEVVHDSYDASDALAVAVCHHYQGNSGPQGIAKGVKGWEDFIRKNPDKIKL
jgi:crossover junction endodeoxyribonuclease RuvC